MENYVERAICDWTEDSTRIIATPSVTAKFTFFYVQEVGHFQTKPEYYTERQLLNSFLIVYTLSGKGHLRYKDKEYTLSPYQVFFIDCMEKQFYFTDKVDLWEIVWIHFNGSSSRGYYEEFIKQGSSVMNMDQHSRIPSTIQQIIEVHREKNILTEALSSKLIVDLLTELLLANNEHDLSGSFLPAHIKDLMKYLDQRFNQKMTLDALAQKTAMSKFHLVREFKRYTGFTPNEYVINSRITYAKELLKYSDLPIADISIKVGIENISHFISLFKNREEVTPLVFRKKWQNQK